MATSCSNTSRRLIIPCEQVGLIVAATRWGDTSQRQIASCVQEKFCENLCLRNRIFFCRCNKSQKIKSDWICATCCGDKILLQQQRFSQKSYSTHEAICRCWCVTATCWYNLSPSVYRPRVYSSLSSFSTSDKKYRECTDTMERILNKHNWPGP